MSYTLLEDQRELLQLCPRCGKTALAQPRENLYRCLWCGFESDVSEAPVRFPFLLFLAVAVLLFTVFVLG